MCALSTSLSTKRFLTAASKISEPCSWTPRSARFLLRARTSTPQRCSGRTRSAAEAGPAAPPTGASYASASSQAGEGRRAGITLQRVLTGVSLVAAREGENRENRLHTPLDGVTPLPRVLPSGDAYTEEEARRRSRPLHPLLLHAMREGMPFLQKYKEFPRVYARKLYNNASVIRGTRTANVIMNGCALCGQCEVICPRALLHGRSVSCRPARRRGARRHAGLSPRICAGRHGAGLRPGKRLSAGRPRPCRAGQARREPVFPRLSAGGLAGRAGACHVPPSARPSARRRVALQHISHSRRIGGPDGRPFSASTPRRSARDWESCGKPEILAACSSCMTALKLALPEAKITSLWSKLDSLMTEPFASRAPPRHERAGSLRREA